MHTDVAWTHHLCMQDHSLDGILLLEFIHETSIVLYLEHFSALIPNMISGKLVDCTG